MPIEPHVLRDNAPKLISFVFPLESYFIMKTIDKKKEKKLREEQTEIALMLFLAECFDEWVNTDKKNK